MPREAEKAREAIIEFCGSEPDGLAEFAAAHPNDITLIRAKGFGAFDYTTQALLVLGPTIVVQVGTIVRAHVEAGKQVRIKVDGTEIEAPDPDSALQILERLGIEGDGA